MHRSAELYFRVHQIDTDDWAQGYCSPPRESNCAETGSSPQLSQIPAVKAPKRTSPNSQPLPKTTLILIWSNIDGFRISQGSRRSPKASSCSAEYPLDENMSDSSNGKIGRMPPRDLKGNCRTSVRNLSSLRCRKSSHTCFTSGLLDIATLDANVYDWLVRNPLGFQADHSTTKLCWTIWRETLLDGDAFQHGCREEVKRNNTPLRLRTRQEEPFKRLAE